MDRNAQFEYINKKAGMFLTDGQPVISVDTRTKPGPVIGSYGGLRWCDVDSKAEVLKPTDQPEDVLGFCPAIEVVGAQILIESTILQHMVCGGQERSGDGADGLFCPAPGSQTMELSLRAPGPLPARGTIWGAQGFWVRLNYGLVRTKKTPTSVPATTAAYARVPPVSYPAGRGNFGGGQQGGFDMKRRAADNDQEGIAASNSFITLRTPIAAPSAETILSSVDLIGFGMSMVALPTAL